MEQALTLRILSSFFIGIVIIFITAQLIGKENKNKWFKKRQQFGFFNMRGLLGETCHFGHPRTLQGAIVMVTMYTIIFSLAYYIIFMM